MATLAFVEAWIADGGLLMVEHYQTTSFTPGVFDLAYAPTLSASGGAVTVSGEVDDTDDWCELEVDGSDYNVWIYRHLSRRITSEETVTLSYAAAEMGAVDDAGTPNATEDSLSAVAVRNLSHCDADGNPHFPLRVGAPHIANKADPASIWSGIELDLNAESIAGVDDGNTFATWEDDSAEGNDFAPSSGTMTYRAAASNFGNRPAVDLDDVSGLLGSLAINPSTDSFTIVVFHLRESRTRFRDSNLTATTGRLAEFDTGTLRLDIGGFNVHGLGQANRARCAGHQWDQSAGESWALGTHGYRGGGRSLTPASWTGTVTFETAGTSRVARVIVVRGIVSEELLERGCAYLDELYQTQAQAFYIDPASGSNSNPGTEASPWADWPGEGSPGREGCYLGEGDQFYIKRGTTDYNPTNAMALAASTLNWGFGNSPEYPGVLGAYGEGAPPTLLKAPSRRGRGPQCVFGLHLRNPSVDPLDASYVGYASLGATSTIGLYGTSTGTPASSRPHQATCYSLVRNIVEFSRDSLGWDGTTASVTNRYASQRENVVWNNYYYRSTVDRTLRPSGLFTVNQRGMQVVGNVMWRPGWNPDVASIGDWSSGSEVWEDGDGTGLTATYSASSDETTLSDPNTTAPFSLFEFTATVVGPIPVRVRSKSDTGTIYTATILSKTSNNAIVLEGNPFSLADTGTVTDVEAHGGLPAGRNGQNHGIYYANSNRGPRYIADNVIVEPCDHGFQARAGGLCLRNIVIESAIAGFSGPTAVGAGGYARIRRCIALGGTRTTGRSDGSLFSGVRCWGFSLNDEVGELRVGDLERNIVNMESVDEDDAQLSTFGLQSDAGASALRIRIRRNTVTGTPHKAIKVNDHTAGVPIEISRNIAQQPDLGFTEGEQRLINWLPATGYDDAATVFAHNVVFHYSGVAGAIYEIAGTDQTLAEWTSDTGEAPDFKEVTFTEKRTLAGYNASLGGTETDEAFVDDAMAALIAGTDIADYFGPAPHAWIEAGYKPTNLSQGDYGDDSVGAVDWVEAGGGGGGSPTLQRNRANNLNNRRRAWLLGRAAI